MNSLPSDIANLEHSDTVMPGQAKHITFEEPPDGHDGPDGHSSASDEDRNPLEV